MIRKRLNYLRKVFSSFFFGPMNEYRGLKLEIESLSNELHVLEDKKTASFHALAKVTEQFVEMNQRYGYASCEKNSPGLPKPIIVDRKLLQGVTKLKAFRMN